MNMIIETERLIIRELTPRDAADLFEMDADPEVHRFIENNPVKSIEEIDQVIDMLRKQYLENGIARWAVVDKSNQECVGWCGLKYVREPLNEHQNYYDLGYRFKRKHWNKGYATESASAILNYAHDQLDINEVYAIVNPKNENSKKVLLKLGFTYINTFDYDSDPTDWFELKK